MDFNIDKSAIPEIQLASEDSNQASSIPQFESALDYTTVRDFAYPSFHPLHYGVPQASPSSVTDDGYNNMEYLDDGPPWQEDADLASPVIKSHDVGDRISREYEFSVASADEIHGRAVALFDFTPENDNEYPLREGQLIWVSYRHGQGWLVAEDPDTGETGLVPEEYVEIISNHEARRIHEAQIAAAAARLDDDELDNDDLYNDNTTNNNLNPNFNDNNHDTNNDTPDSFHSPEYTGTPLAGQRGNQEENITTEISQLDLTKN